ncbi:MAG: metalloregulator ArsR/SmtB family transcription factor [bacterium]|nr:metalloregulator ArsR/SmtB family transcription factor [bacterium]
MKDTWKDYTELAGLFSLFSHPVRLKILDTLASSCSGSGEGCCVLDMNKKIRLPQPYLSKHLKILKDKKVLTYKRAGNKIYYTFNKSRLLKELTRYLLKYSDCCG